MLVLNQRRPPLDQELCLQVSELHKLQALEPTEGNLALFERSVCVGQDVGPWRLWWGGEGKDTIPNNFTCYGALL